MIVFTTTVLKTNTPLKRQVTGLNLYIPGVSSEESIPEFSGDHIIRSQVNQLLRNGGCDPVNDRWEAFKSRSVEIRQLVSSFLNSSETSDVALMCTLDSSGDSTCVVEVLCHRCILISNSDFFKALLGELWSPLDEGKDRRVTRRTIRCDADSKHVHYLLRYLYGDDIFHLSGQKIDPSAADAMSVYALAHYWSCPAAVLDAITDYIYSVVGGDTAMKVFSFADTFSLPRLKDLALTLAVQQKTVTGAPESGEGLDISPLCSDIHDCIEVLREACDFVKSKHNFIVDGSVREVVACLKECLVEEEEVWKASAARHADFVAQHCAPGEVADGAYAARLKRVQDSLRRQERAVQRKRDFYERLQKPLDLLGL